MSWFSTRFTSGPSFSVSAHFLARSGSARQAAFFLVRSSRLSQPQM